MQQQLEEDIATSNIQEGADSIAQDEADQLLESMEGIRPTGRMVIDLASMIEQPGNYDVVLKDGDQFARAHAESIGNGSG